MSKQEVRILERKLKRARNNKKLREVSDLCCSLAACLTENEEYEEALNLYRESLKASETLDNKEGIILANRMIAETCNSLGYFDEALKHVNVFLKYAQNDCNKVEEQRGLVLKGHVFFTQAEYLIDAKPWESEHVAKLLEQSMDAYRKSFAICLTQLTDISEKEKLQMKARLLQNKSLVLIRQNKLDHAQNHLIRAVKICSKEKLKDTECICYLSLGDLYVRKEEYDNALNVFNKAFELSTSVQRKMDSLIAKTKVCIFKGDFEAAKTVLKSAYKMKANDEVKKILKHIITVIKIEKNLKVVPESDWNNRKDLYKKLGNIYCTLNVFKKGIDTYLNMLTCCQKSGFSQSELTYCYRKLCQAFTSDKQYDKALFYCNQEIKSHLTTDPEKACKTYFRIAKLHELNNSDYEEIYFAYVQAKAKCDEFKNKKLKLNCLRCIMRIAKKFNKGDVIVKTENEIRDCRGGSVGSSCDSDSCSELEGLDSDRQSEQSSGSDIDVWEVLQESDAENEEFDRPKERCRRTKFSIKRNEKGETDLHVAAIKGNHRKVKALIDKGHPVNIRDTAGWTPLHEACNHGYVDIVNTLLDSGADINDKGGPCCDGITPLHDAATNGQMEIIDILIKRGASVLVLNNFGETPLQCLINWKKNSALDDEEEIMFKKIVKGLKSPLDTNTIKSSGLTCSSSSDRKVDGRNGGGGKSLRKSPLSNTRKSPDKREMLVLSQRKRQAKGWSEDEDSPSEDSESSTDSKENLACNMYRKAISNLRHKPKKFKRNEWEKERTKRALIDERNYVENCILDNDEDSEDDEEDVAPRKDPEPERRSPCFKVTRNQNDNFSAGFSDLEDDCLDRLMKDIEGSPGLLTNGRKSSEESDTSEKPWLKDIPSSLLSDPREVSPTRRDETQVTSSISDGYKMDTNKSTSPKCSSANLTDTPDTVDVVVRVVNRDISIPVKRSELTILRADWLIQQVAKQCPHVADPDYCVTLKTVGSTISDSDTLAIVADEKIDLIATKWKLFPIWERYEKLCARTNHTDMTPEVRSFTFKYTAQPHISDALKTGSSGSRRFTLSNLKLSALTLVPICKAVKYETFVQTLNLSNNYFGDKGLELIVKIFDRCIIEELDVSGCNITSSGVYHLSEAFGNVNELSRNGLQVLNLGKNPITDDAVDGINNLISKLPNLTILNVDRCELETAISSQGSPNLLIIQGSSIT